MDHLQHISTPMVDVTLISSTHKLPQAQLSDAVVQRCSVKKVFLEISQYSQENTFARVCFLIKLQA